MAPSKRRGRIILLGGVLFTLIVVALLVVPRLDVADRVREIGVRRLAVKVWNRVRREGLVATVRGVFPKPVDAVPAELSTLGYSLIEPSSMPPVEDSATRNALPEYVEVPAVDVRTLPPSQGTPSDFDTWYRSGADEQSTKYSSLNQINTGNVRYLQPAWSYTSGSDLGDSTKTGGMTVETNPIVVGRRLFLSTIDGDLISLDAETGEEIWRLALPAPVARRGLVWEPNERFERSRLFVPSGKGVYAVDPATGKILTDFGSNGVVGSGTSVIAPLIMDDRLIIATLAPALEAYDLKTGVLLWTRPLLEATSGNGTSLTGGAPWGGMSADRGRQTVFVVTGNPRPALIGVTRPGKNAYSCSLVAVDARTGAVRWSFQEIEHDLWDLDLAAPPILTTITHSGRKVDVVAALTKRGNTVLLDRDRGKAIFGYRLRRTPVSAIPGEQTAPYQPVFSLPEPFADQEFTPDEITDVSDSATRVVSRKLRDAKYGFFVPPVIGGKVALWGIHGGAEWPGGAVDPTTGILFVPSNQVPWVIRTQYTDVKATAKSGAGLEGDSLYRGKCASCHGAARRGSFEWEGMGDAYFPALTGITVLRRQAELESTVSFGRQHEGVRLASAVSGDDLKILYGYFAELDKRADKQRTFALNAFWQVVLDERGDPGSKAPWGLLTALDLNTGRKVWQVPFGESERRRPNGEPVRGLRNMGGVAVTAGGVLFATGTTDNKVRAYRAVNGQELWSYVLPAAGSTSPTVYSSSGVQYVVVVATGGNFRGFSGRADRVIAFRLPPERR